VGRDLSFVIRLAVPLPQIAQDPVDWPVGVAEVAAVGVVGLDADGTIIVGLPEKKTWRVSKVRRARKRKSPDSAPDRGGDVPDFEVLR
jgi:hypothetical protein